MLSFSPCLALRPRDSTLCGTPDCNVPTGDSDSRRPESRQYILTGSICRIAVSRPPLSACRFIRVVRCVSLVTTLTRTRTLTLNNVGVRVGALSRSSEDGGDGVVFHCTLVASEVGPTRIRPRSRTRIRHGNRPPTRFPQFSHWREVPDARGTDARNIGKFAFGDRTIPILTQGGVVYYFSCL